MAAAKASMSTLPVEMLQQIFSEVDSKDLLTLRLTSKTLEAVVFDAFADEYLRVPHCALLDKLRLQRLSNMLSCARLVSGMQLVALIREPLELKDWRTVQLAPEQKHFRFPQSAQKTVYSTILDEAKQQGRFANVDVAMLVTVMRQAATLGLPIGIRMDDMYSAKLCGDSAGHDVCNAAASAQCPVDILELDNKALVYFELLLSSNGSALKASLRSTRELTLNLAADDILERRSFGSVAAVAQVVSCFAALEALFVCFRGTSSAQRDPRFVHIPRDLLQANRLSHLKRLNIEMVRISQRDLLDVLMRCQPTLEDLCLFYVALVSSQEAWSAVLRFLLTLPRLQDLYILKPLQLCDGHFHAVEVTKQDMDYASRLSIQILKDSDGDGGKRTRGRGCAGSASDRRQAIRRELEDVLKCGLSIDVDE